MTDQPYPYQPGPILYGAVLGAFRSHGSNLERWLKANGVTPIRARNALFGLSAGPIGQALAARIIEDAGADLVRAGYMSQLRRHMEEAVRASDRIEDLRRREKRAS